MYHNTRFKEFEALFNDEDESLKSLGLKTSDEEKVIKSSCIDLNRVESFFPTDDYNGEPMTSLEMYSGDIWSIKISYDEFKKIIHDQSY